MMTESEKQQFAFFTAQLAQLATAVSVPATQPLAVALLPKLTGEIVGAYPEVNTFLQKLKAERQQAVTAQMVANGPALWKALHTRALAPVADPAAEQRWLMTEFPKGLPKDCTCKTDYFRFLQSNKPDFTAYFAWTVSLHNFVNRKLSKPELTVEAAHAIWAK